MVISLSKTPCDNGLKMELAHTCCRLCYQSGSYGIDFHTCFKLLICCQKEDITEGPQELNYHVTFEANHMSPPVHKWLYVHFTSCSDEGHFHALRFSHPKHMQLLDSLIVKFKGCRYVRLANHSPSELISLTSHIVFVQI